jgi:hypothetical protein
MSLENVNAEYIGQVKPLKVALEDVVADLLYETEWSYNKVLKLKFVNAAVSSECYSGKRRAFGLGAMKCEGHCKTPTSKGTPGDLLLLDDDSDSDEWAHGVLEAVSVGSFESGDEE